MTPTAPVAAPLSPQALGSLSASDQAAYLKNLQSNPALMAAIANQQKQAAVQDFMRHSKRYPVPCPVQGGGFSASYVPGTAIVFEMPTVPNGYATAIKLSYALTVTLATGTGATYQKTAAAPHSAVQEVLVTLGNSQARLHPYISKVLGQLRGRSGAQYGVVNAGQDLSSLDSALFNSLPVVAGANTWTFQEQIPLNPIAADDPRGLIPLSGVGNQPTVTVTPAATFYGTDPLQNSVAALAGTGNALTSVTGTVTCEIIVLDGDTTLDTNIRSLDLTGYSTMQYTKEPEQQNLLSAALYRAKINTLLKHWYMITLVIDGQSPAKFCDDTNIQIIQLSKDQTGNNNWWNFGQVNTSVNDLYGELRYGQQQDLDHGVIPFVKAPHEGINDPSNRSGSLYLNMMNGGFPAATYAIQVGTATNANGINPRLVTYLVSENPAGLQRS